MNLSCTGLIDGGIKSRTLSVVQARPHCQWQEAYIIALTSHNTYVCGTYVTRQDGETNGEEKITSNDQTKREEIGEINR